MTRQDTNPAQVGDRWAEAYDNFFAGRDTDAIVRVIEHFAPHGPVLELGIGTGEIAIHLLEKGLDVRGIEVSPKMVERMYSKPRAREIPVTPGDLVVVEWGGPYELIYAISDVFSLLLTQERQLECLRRAANSLLPGGVMLINSHIPGPGRFDRTNQRIELRSINPEQAVILMSRHDPVQQHVDSYFVTLSQDRGVEILGEPKRYVPIGELQLMAQMTGFVIEALWGDWEAKPYKHGECIAILRRAT